MQRYKRERNAQESEDNHRPGSNVTVLPEEQRTNLSRQFFAGVAVRNRLQFIPVADLDLATRCMNSTVTLHAGQRCRLSARTFTLRLLPLHHQSSRGCG